MNFFAYKVTLVREVTGYGWQLEPGRQVGIGALPASNMDPVLLSVLAKAKVAIKKSETARARSDFDM